MKQHLILLLLILSSCCKEENKVHSDCIQMEQNPDFVSEELNQDYTIQFPSDYKGEGLMIDESADFLKYSDNVMVKYSFLCPTDCIKFYGGSLDHPIPNFVIVSTIDGTLIFNQRVELCKNDIIEAVFYHNSDNLTFGTLYLRIEDKYLESANIQYKKEKAEEVISILMTLQKT